MRDAAWRVGRKVKRTVYIGDELVGLMDTPELADEVVRAVNNRRMVESVARETSARLNARLDSLREDRDAYVRRLSRCREVRDQLRAENADLRRLCADEHSREGQATDSHVKAGVDGTVSVSTDNGKTWSEPESVTVEDGTFTVRVQATSPGANPDDVCAYFLCSHKRKDHLSWDGEPAICGHPDCHASADLHCQAFVEAPTPAPDPSAAESQPVQVRETDDPPRVWWDPIRGLLLCDRDVDHRLVDEPPAYNDCVALVPAATADPNACTCRPIRGGLDVDKHCPSHGWRS